MCRFIFSCVDRQEKPQTSLVTGMRLDNVRPHGQQRRYLGWILLVAYLLFLAYRTYSYGVDSEPANTLMCDPHDSCGLIEWISAYVLRVFWDSACFVPVGFLAALVAPRSERLRRFSVGVPAVAIASALTILVYGARFVCSSRPLAAVGLALALLGCLFGMWAGMAWLCGWRARLWFLPKVALLAAAALLFPGAVLWLSLEEKPLPFEATRVTSAEKRRLVHLIRGAAPGSLQETRIHTLQLTEHDINVLLSWALSFGQQERKALVSLNHDSASLLMSIVVPLGGSKPRYVNLRVASAARIENGIPNLCLERCRVGSVDVPRRCLRSLSSFVAALLSHDRRSVLFLSATKEMMIEPDSIRLTYDPVRLFADFREGFLGLAVVGEQLLASTQSQVDHLLVLTVISELLDSQPSLGWWLETAFAFARDHSTQGDPVMENQAAILALGMLIGHSRIGEILGSVPPGSEGDVNREVLHRVALRGRSDWARHFCVSAAITVLSDQAISDAAGVLKEELDADAGGSGFSFTDLLADRAGTAFAISATCDEAAARAMQDRLAQGIRADEFFPPADDLPDNVSHTELESCYGGVGGERYRRLIREIEQRIAACAAYQ